MITLAASMVPTIIHIKTRMYDHIEAINFSINKQGVPNTVSKSTVSFICEIRRIILGAMARTIR